MSGMVPAVAGVVRWRTTPDRVRGMTVITVLGTVALSLVAAVAFGGIAGGLRLIGQQSEPEVLATTDLYYRLNDMDAQVANVLLVGGQHGLGIDRQQAQALYEQDRLRADQDLQHAAVVAASVPSAQQTLRSILDGLGRYEALAGEAMYLDGRSRAGRPPAAALALYRQATDLLQNGTLPSARGLTDQNATVLDRAYQARRSTARLGTLYVALIGVALSAVLMSLQLYLALRYRRIFNPALAAATAAVLALVTVTAIGLSGQARDLYVAKAEAFDSIVALSQARAVSDDANADESRYLVDPARGGRYQQAFEDKSQQLARLPGAGIYQYDAALARVVSAYRGDYADVRFGGYLGAEFRNITFPGERAAAWQALTAYQVYERDDRHIRALNQAGDLRQAIAFDTSYVSGNSDWAFTQYDRALVTLVAINQRGFTAAIGAAQHDATGWSGPIPAVAAVLIVGLIVAGVRPRLAEYK